MELSYGDIAFAVFGIAVVAACAYWERYDLAGLYMVFWVIVFRKHRANRKR